MIKNTVWMTYAEYLPIELKQAKEEGKDIEKFRSRIEEIMNLTEEDCAFEEKEKRAWLLLDEIEQEEVRRDFPYSEPDDLDEIRKRRDENRGAVYQIDRDMIWDKVYGAWMGRCIGCVLGQPVESWKRSRIVGFLKDTGNYPVKTFMASDVDPEIIERYQVSNNGENAFCDTVTHWINNITDMPEDDDTNYTAIGLKVLETHGKDFTSEDMAQMWITSLPMGHVSTSERVAYRNIGNLIEAPRCGWWKNPYREWIGAQIRADIFGYVSPGKPEEAARMAWTDGRISHVKNGIYGEMFIAAMLAAAFAETDPVKLTEAALGQIPKTSRLYEEIQMILKDYAAGMSVYEAIDKLHAQFNEADSHDWCHTITNAAAVTISVLYSELDFEKALGLSMECGYDTDCNGATVGSVLGLITGYERIPESWKSGLTGFLRTGVSGFHQISIKELAMRTCKLIEG